MKSLHQCKCSQTTTKIITGNEIKADVTTRLVLLRVTLNGDNLDFLFLNETAGKNKAELLNLNTKLYSDKKGFGGS